MNFKELHLIPPILKALELKGYKNPTPIQERSIPIILEGNDLLGCAQTGTGKTAAFAIPTLQRLCESREKFGPKRGIKALIITPTRELAIQIDENFTAYGKGTGLKNIVIFGGIKQHSQVRKLQSGVDILIATPGRLLDLMSQGFISLKSLEIFTLDEADRMLDMGFVHDIKKVIAKLPAKRQSLFFSATMPPAITKLANTLLTNPKRVEVAPVSSTAETVEQRLFLVDRSNKKKLLTHILEAHDIPSALVFTRTKHGANKIADFMNKSGIKAQAIHGNKSQNARQNALKNFKNRETRVLVATDIAARGIDIDELSHVINFEIPNEPETYVHRIGRTGRAQNSGIAFSFCDHEERNYIKDIHKLINKEIPVDGDHPFPMSKNPVDADKSSTGPIRRNSRNRSRKPFRSRNKRDGQRGGHGKR